MRSVGCCLFFLIVAAADLACTKSSCNVVPSSGPGGTSFFFGEYPDLRLPNGVAVADKGGIAGLIVVNLGGNQYVAYDRYSTVQGGCPVELEESGLTVKDPCTGARYVLLNGSPIDIAKCSLKPYYAARRNQGDAVYVQY